MIRQASASVAVCALLMGAPAAAQEHRAWPERGFVTIDVPYQPLNNSFSESVTITDVFRKSEQDAFSAAYGSTKGVLVDVGGGVRLAGSFGVGVTASWFRRSGDATVDLSVPNPLTANRPRTLNGTVTGLNRREIALHVQALYAVPLGHKARLMLSGGPSAFQVRQDVVQGVDFDEAPGFSSITLKQVLTTGVTRTIVGFNAGADVTWRLGSHFGVGSVTRYSRATFTADPGSVTPALTRSIEARAGGLQIGAGVRILF